MSKANRYSTEVKERAVRMVLEHEGEYASQWQAIQSIAAKIGCSPDSLKAWLKRTQVDSGQVLGTTTNERERIKALEKENKELHRANEILKTASVSSSRQCNTLAQYIPRRSISQGFARSLVKSFGNLV